MDKKILKQLKSDYEELEIQPSADVWSKIEAGTEKEQTLQWWKYAAVITLLISFGTFFYFKNSTDDKRILTKISSQTKIRKLDILIQPSDSKTGILVNAETQSVDVNSNLIKTESNLNLPVLSATEKISEKNAVGELIEENEDFLTPSSKETDHPSPVKQTYTERKKVNYTNAEQLLLGRELDKTREENQNEQKKFGVLDIGKIKIKAPNSFKILGFTVYSDSLQAK